VRDETAVSDYERRRFDAALDAHKKRTHRAAVAEADVGDPVTVDVGSRAQNIDSALQILHQLNLLGPIVSVEPDGLSTAAGKRGVNRNHHSAEIREKICLARDVARSAREPVHEHDAG